MEDKSFNEAMELIVSALKERGYDPYSQIYGYLKENEPAYITSHKGARALIQQFSHCDVECYIKNYNIFSDTKRYSNATNKKES